MLRSHRPIPLGSHVGTGRVGGERRHECSVDNRAGPPPGGGHVRLGQAKIDERPAGDEQRVPFEPGLLLADGPVPGWVAGGMTAVPVRERLDHRGTITVSSPRHGFPDRVGHDANVVTVDDGRWDPVGRGPVGRWSRYGRDLAIGMYSMYRLFSQMNTTGSCQRPR
jgi:hypothetical protein